MLGFIVLTLAFIGSQQVTAEAEPNHGTFIHDVPNPTVLPDYKPYPHMPNPWACPKFPIIPYHYPCNCHLAHCLDSYIEAEAEALAQNSNYLTLCDIQQIFLLIQSVAPGIDPATQVSIVSMIIYGLEMEIYNGGYIPTIPEYCDQYSGLDQTMGYYSARMQYMLDRTMPRLSDELEAILRQTIEMSLQGVYEFDEGELYYKLSFCLRSILANMIDTTPYVL